MIIPEIIFLFANTSPLVYSSTEDSVRKLPTAIDNPSTNNKIIPVSNIVDLGTSATATPDKSPTVETKLSSTPKIKFLKYETDENFVNNIFV